MGGGGVGWDLAGCKWGGVGMGAWLDVLRDVQIAECSRESEVIAYTP